MSSFGNERDLSLKGMAGPDQFTVVPWTPDLPLREDMAWVMDHMEAKRAGRQFCSRKDVSPGQLGKYLPRITILEAVYDDAGVVIDARYRLMGTEISMLYGEATGQLISSYHGPHVLQRVCRITNHCIEAGGPALGLSKALSDGRQSVDVSVLYIPLSPDDKNVDQFLIYSAVERKSLARF
ncbi:MAG: PAS domain-containing protein [Alphaproteobacteria bacterium]|nr:PAS domain-containing protein [Alphaproteobacteria bacterium]